MSPQWLVVIGLIIVVYFLFIKKRPAVKDSNENNNKNSKKDEIQSNEMVECSACGIYCELEESILSNNKYYCSEECLEKS